MTPLGLLLGKRLEKPRAVALGVLLRPKNRAVRGSPSADLMKVLKGDVAGHDFYGNQWTDGQGEHTDESGFKRSGNLSPAERKVEQAFYDRIKENPAAMIAAYKEKFGNTIDSDNVKALSPDYARNTDMAAAVHEPSSLLSKMIFSDALSNKAASGDTSATVFTAGGSGSGKSEAMKPALYGIGAKPGGLVMDSVLGNKNSATAKIDEALSKTSGSVAIVYTNAPIEKAYAFNAVRERAVKTSVLVNAHISASNNIRALAEHYKDNPRVKITIINNPGTISQMHLGSLKDVPTYDRKAVDRSLSGAAKELRSKGAIDGKRYKHIIRKSESGDDRGARRRISAGNRGQKRESAYGQPRERSQLKSQLSIPGKVSIGKLFKYGMGQQPCACALLKSEKMPPTKRYVLANEKDTSKKIKAIFTKWGKKVGAQVAKSMNKGDVAGHEFHGNQYKDGSDGSVPTHRSLDGRAVEKKPLAGSYAERRGIKIGSKVSYNATSMMGDAHRGTGKVVGFVPNKQGYSGTYKGKVTQDVVMFDSRRNSYMFIEDLNVRNIHPRKVDLGTLLKVEETTQQIVDRVMSNIDLDGFSVELLEAIRDDLLEAFRTGGIKGIELIGFKNDESITNLVNEQAVIFARDRAAELVGMKWDDATGSFIDNPNPEWSITETTRNGIRSLTTKAIESGDSTDDIAARLSESYGFSDARAETIARTELAHAHVEGNLSAWAESGVVSGKESILADTHPEEDVCDENEAAGVIEFDSPFPSGDMAPPYHPNCLCDVLPVLAEDSSNQEE